MSLYCADGLLSDMPPPVPPAPKPARGEPWKPPEIALCQRCGRASWQHRSYPPLLADEIDRAIYAAAFVAEMRDRRSEPPGDVAQDAVINAEGMVERHRRARSGA